MATEKQIAWIKKLSKWSKTILDFDKIEKMDNGELDKVFTELTDKMKYQKAEKKSDSVVPKVDFNGQRFGMCCNQIADAYGIPKCSEVADESQEKIKQLYNWYTKLEIEMCDEINKSKREA